MEKPALTDSSIFPTEAVLRAALARSYAAWKIMMTMIEKKNPLISIEWNYYRDGKRWLAKMTLKKKTIAWLSVWEKHFKVTFYFTDKFIPDVLRLPITEELKKIFMDAKKSGSIRPFTVNVSSKKALNDISALIPLKISTL